MERNLYVILNINNTMKYEELLLNNWIIALAILSRV